MKNISKIIFVMVFGCIFLCGCGSENLEKTLKNTKDVKSYTMTINVNQDSTKTKTVSEVDIKNKKIKNTSEITVDNKTVSTTSYVETVDNKTTMYSNGILGDQWIISEIENTSDVESFDNYLSAIDIKNIKKVKNNEKSINKYEININSSKLNIKGSNDIKAYLYTNGEYIQKIEMSSKTLKYNAEILFSNLNKTKVNIPSDVKENAKKISDVDYSNIDMSSFDNIKDNSNISNNNELQKQLEEYKNYINSDEYKEKMKQLQEKLNSEQVQEQIQQAQDYMQSDEYKNKVQEAQDYMQSDEYKNQMNEAQQRLQGLMGQ